MKTRYFMLLSVLSMAAFFSCSKENNSGSGIHYQLRASNQGITQPAGTARPTVAINWTSGFANVSEIKFEAENSSGEIEYRSTINQKVDIFNPFATIGTIPVPPGTYNEVEFKAKLEPANGEPAFELRGDYSGTPVVLQVPNGFEFEVERDNVTIASNMDYASIINLQLGLLTADISDTDLANAVRTNGEIIISPTSNPELYYKITNRLDEIEDGEFDEDHDSDDCDEDDDD